jgi:hypothetical protein
VEARRAARKIRNQWQKLIELLPFKLAGLRVPPNYPKGLPIKCKTIAE